MAGEIRAEQGRRDVAKWALALCTTAAIGIGSWAHLRLWSDNDRLTRLETQREIEGKALEQRLASMEGNLSKQIADLKELIRGGGR